MSNSGMVRKSEQTWWRDLEVSHAAVDGVNGVFIRTSEGGHDPQRLFLWDTEIVELVKLLDLIRACPYKLSAERLR